jgi:uncharacterized protein YjbI with pentapeptide repeats
MTQSKLESRRTQSAIRRIDLFEKRFGKPHLYLAYHAAFPLSLTPDLLYRLWAHFQQDVHGYVLDIPWSAVADFLLSNLCEAVGHELNEIESEVREELLRRLKTDLGFNGPDFDQNRIMQLADFLLEYVEQQLHSDDPDAQAFAQAQQWLALAYTRPGKTVEQIAQTLRSMQATTNSTPTNEPELLRLASLVETLSEPLMEAGLTPLLVYFRGIESFARGDLESATTQLESIAESGKIEIGGEELPVPESIRARWTPPDQAAGADFSYRKLRGRSFKGQDLTGANFSHADLRGANFIGATLTGANFSHAKMGMQRRWAIGLMVCCYLFALFSGIGITLVGLAFGSSLTALEKGSAASSPTEFSWATLNDLLSWSSLFILVAFASFYLTSKRKNWQTLCKTWTLALIISPTLFMISTLLKGYRLPSVQYFFPLASESACTILFGVLSYWIIVKGLKSQWIASAIAGVGSTYFGVIVAWSLVVSLSSLTKEPLTFMLSTLTVVFILIPLLVVQTTGSNKRTRIAVLVTAILTGVGIGAVLFLWLPSQNNMTRGIVISIAGAVASALLTLALTWHGSRSNTLAEVFLGVGGFALLVALFPATVIVFQFMSVLLNGVVWALSGGVLILVVATIPATFSAQAGILHLRGAILGIITLCIIISVFVGLLGASSSNLMSSDMASGIGFSVAFLAGLIIALALAITMALSITIAWAESGDRRLAMVWASILIATPIALTGAVTLIFGGVSLVIAGTAILALAIFQLGIYISMQAISGDPKFNSIRQAALAITSLGGTNFWGANLSGANFTQATLKSVNFKQANLTHALWSRSKKINLAYAGDSYLQYPQIQQMLTTGIVQEQNFDYLNLRGINLRRANLKGARFVGTNLEGADLQQADLSGAKLIDAQLDGGNLAGANLTGIYWHNCQCSPSTALEGVECKYIYTIQDGSTLETSTSYHEIRFRTGGFANFARNLSNQAKI